MNFFILAFTLMLSFKAFSIDRYCNGALTVIHPNGGGHVAMTASVASTAFVGPSASVCDFAMVFGTAEIRDSARVSGVARINDGATVSGNAQIFGNVILKPDASFTITVTDNAQVYGNSKLLGAVVIKGNSKVFENARITSNAVIDETASVYGNATITGNAQIKGNSKIYGRSFIGGDVISTTGANICEGRYFEANTVLNSTICTAPSSGLLTTIQVATGGAHTCSLYTSGRIRCWGSGSNGQLGYGNVNNIGDNEAPSSAVYTSIGGAAIQVAAGETHTCALFNTGNVGCWGQATSGQLGYGNTINIGDNELPLTAGLVFVGGAVSQITAGLNHTCALMSTGAVRCWGSSGSGQLGYGNTATVGAPTLPATVGDVSVGGIVTQVSAGTNHTCALLDTGAVRCWGQGNNGKLGYGNTNSIGDNELPSTAGDVNIGGTVIQIAAGGEHTCALLSTGRVRCWGQGSTGQLGYGNVVTIGDNEAPAVTGDIDLGGTAIQITAGVTHTCALLATGAVRCWGQPTYGQLGYGNTNIIGDNEVPSLVGDVDIGDLVTQVSAGRDFTCATLVSGRVRCWGLGSSGQLGYGNINNIGDNEVPSSVGNVLNLISRKDHLKL